LQVSPLKSFELLGSDRFFSPPSFKISFDQNFFIAVLQMALKVG
jgi:hypothetical protein